MSPVACVRLNCPRVVYARGLCRSHYAEKRRNDAKREERARVRASVEVPVGGLGVLRCAVCNRVLAELPVSHTCLEYGLARL